MSLNQHAAQRRLAIFEDLRAGRAPREGTYSEAVLAEARTKGQPQLGATRYAPQAIVVEFIFPDPKGSTALLEVRLDPPERIVFLPVPRWVVESIWQGEIEGSYHFESDARRLVTEFAALLEPEANAAVFDGRRDPAGRPS